MGGLSLLTGLNLSLNAISYFDRQFQRGEAQLKGLEEKLQQDPRFPDHDSFIRYIKAYPKTLFLFEGATLSFLNSITLPQGAVRYRFNLSETLNGRLYVRPVMAVASPDGSLELKLEGIAH